ncbi:hypothetical protein B5T_03603 [Alloalcanivorax dieselolei B5]|uniref:Tle cognate immunity protein 4 C-terminal domain-containing protein n=2 Tax=Alloalcanivorax dieselolei TaxID=285091 RepID=K0CE32_ALCDB|nr:hypothetical protein B5T_03603 [Alloalcanivorax dieselolei B5]GGK01866.1 hypothetical protein GCM10007426_33630 [Alloalcanivorax dieselolei]
MLLAGCGPSESETKDYALMNQIPLTVECVGHMRIGLPEKGVKSWSATVDGADLKRLKGLSKDAFMDYVQARKNEVAALPHHSEANRLVAFRTFGESGAILLYREDAFQTEVVEMDRYFWVEGGQGSGTGYYLDSGSHFGQVEEDLARFARIFSQFSTRQPGDESASGGFCIDGASLTSDDVGVATDVTVSVPGQPGWDLYVSYARLGGGKAVPETEGIDPRLATAVGSMELEQEKYRKQAQADPDIKQEADYPREFEVLRESRREIGGVKGGEAVWKKELNDGQVLYTFLWMDEALTEQSAVVEMNTRQSGEDSSSEERMLALWDAVLTSAKFQLY